MSVSSRIRCSASRLLMTAVWWREIELRRMTLKSAAHRVLHMLCINIQAIQFNFR
jgi:hypothetical protein